MFSNRTATHTDQTRIPRLCQQSFPLHCTGGRYTRIARIAARESRSCISFSVCFPLASPYATVTTPPFPSHTSTNIGSTFHMH